MIDLDLNSCSDDKSAEEVYKFSLTDVKEERSKEETSMESDYIEEAHVGTDQRVFRFRETSENERRSSSLSSLRGISDMESLRYYKKRKGIRRRSSSNKSRDMESLRYYKRRKRILRRRTSSHCYHIVYNVFQVTKDEEEEDYYNQTCAS